MATETQPSRPLTVCEKILVQHAIGLQSPTVQPGDVIRIAPSWLLSSEAAWYGMERMYNRLGRPGFKRKDRFWLAPDHIVDPRVNDRPKERAVIESCEKIAEEMDLGDNYNPPNVTIMHTEFYRARCQPGMLVIGADSHTGSAGALGALAIGMGPTDLVIQVITGETYLEVPEVVRINFTGVPPVGLSGKDVILGVMKELKRNTVAAGRLVEYTGEGLKYLSCDARFAIANMTTEFGGIGACVVPDAVTLQYMEKRPVKKHKSSSIYFQPDEGAQYAGSYDIDLSKLNHFIALYPSPDNVVPVTEATLPPLQGCFIGACTTTEEDLILGALVLREAMKMGMTPSAPGLRRVTPGSTKIINRLKEVGVLEEYEKAGFVIGAPGCSYCVGMGIDQASKGEVWLSSQNRNFRDRMGPGSIANIASAATVAASSFSMSLQDPQPILDRINLDEYDEMRAYWKNEEMKSPEYSEPTLLPAAQSEFAKDDASSTESKSHLPEIISGKIQRFGDNVDTDSLIPTDKCMLTDREALGRGAFCYTRPEFYDRAQAGAKVLVAEKSFGTGSSREQAPKALQAAGIEAVIAKSYAFIYRRNQANNGLLGIKLEDEEFYKLAQEGAEITINVKEREITCGGKVFPFRLDQIEEELLSSGGLLQVYDKFGTQLFKKLQEASSKISKKIPIPSSSSGTKPLDW
ncbi:3-isopropylmalate dehydratase [Xylogone sp. PMI_703]|nr:3-isopropylmalate dehydratase [Xylogone sp. PMI_703]